MKDRRSEWRGDPLAHRSRRSRSPLMSDKRHDRPKKRTFRSSGRSSAPGEWLQDHPSRRSDHGKELVQELSPPPQQWSHPRRSSLSPRDDGFKFQQEPIFPDHTSSNPSWRLPQSMKNREFRSQINEALPSSYLDVEGQHMLPQKSTFIEEGPSQQLYSNRSMDSTLLNSDRFRTGGGSVGLGIQDNVIYSRNERHRDPYDGSSAMAIQDKEIHSYRDCVRDQYDHMDRKQVYSMDLSYPKVPPPHLKAFIITPSSSILKDDFKGLHHDHISDELATGIRRYPNDPLEHYSYHKVPLSDTLRHDPDESLLNDYDELRRRGLDDHRPRLQDELYKKITRPSRMEDTSTFLKYNEDCMHKADSPSRNLTERTFPDHQGSLYRDFSHDHHVAAAQKEFLTSSDNWHSSLGIKSSEDYDTMHFEEDFTSKKEYFPIPYRADHRNGRSLLSDYELDEQRRVVSTHGRSHIHDLSDYNGERMGRRNYDINGDKDENDLGVVFVNGRHSSAQYESERMWLTEGPVGVSLSKSMLSVHSRNRKFSHSISTSDASSIGSTYRRHRSTGGASSMHAKTDHRIDLKRRLKHLRSNFHTSSSDRENFLRSSEYKKRGMHDRLGRQGGGTHKSGYHLGKDDPPEDPPEDSEEFKQQVHKAFLRYSKLLNESPHSHRMYQNQGNAYSMLCSVCGSSSKEFVDTNSLVIHTYHSLKVGLKTEHLGFHKALCVLLGWNWRVPPDNSRAYQSIPVAEAKAMRDDLILWPPLVIIHNGLTGGSSTKEAKVVTTEGLEKILRDMGFGAGMTRVSLGKLSSPGIFTVKFMPTFSGLQEAQRLHDHFSGKNRGKQDFQQRATSSGKASGNEAEGRAEEVDGTVLYGYMAVAEDLDKVDQETKRRSVVKSRKDIQAIADAPLNTD